MSVDRYRRQFGGIKPLPGQPGYGMKESERLLHETKNMEHKLNKLKAVMSQQREERGVKTGGRWASARSDRGSLRNYNKDVKSGATRRKYVKHNVHSWGTTEVSLWLTALKLERYIDSFVQNEISGSVLLDVGQDDLDYMSITVLGHRKTILKEIEKLKRGRSTVVLPRGGKKVKKALCLLLQTAKGQVVVMGREGTHLITIPALRKNHLLEKFTGPKLSRSRRILSAEAPFQLILRTEIMMSRDNATLFKQL